MLREYLYVDLVRVRSLLAQMDSGVIEKAVESRLEATDKKLGASVLGLSAERSGGESVSVEHSRSLHELVYSIFEDIAGPTKVLRDLDSSDLQEEDWVDGSIHERLVEGEIIRLFTPVLIVDTTFLSQRLQRFTQTWKAVDAFRVAGLTTQLAEAKQPFDAETEELVEGLTVGRDQKKQAEARLRKDRDKQWTLLVAAVEAQSGPAVDSEPIEGIRRFLESYLSSDSIEVRFLAAGATTPERSFAGSLLARDEYIQREREALYSRYGSVLEGWTSVVQIARIPSQEEGQAARDRDFGDLDFMDGDIINRSKVIQSAVHLTEMLEAQGIAEGPIWPTISVVPLAIYRTVPRSEDF